jgi:hypothetical protein
MFTIGYSYSFFSPLSGGAIWDLTARPATAFVPVIVAGLLMIALAYGLALPGQKGPGTIGVRRRFARGEPEGSARQLDRGAETPV